MEENSVPRASRSAVIWQGFQHDWTYNHRLNRFGSYVLQAEALPDTDRPVAVHTAASGTGGDSADFSEYVTWVQDAKGVAFQAGVAETVVECQRGDPEPFVIRIDNLDLAPELQHRDTLTVVINGFDVIATEHAEKLMTMDVEVSEPVAIADGTRVRFQIFGGLCFDCRSPECQLLPWRLEVERVHASASEEDQTDIHDGDALELPPAYQKRGISRRKVDRAVRWLKQRLVKITDVEEVKRSIAGDDGDILRRRLFRIAGRRILLKFLKWRFSALYTLRVHYLLIAGNKGTLNVTESTTLDHDYEWNLDQEIEHATAGVRAIALRGEPPDRYALNTVAFKRLYMDVMIDESQGTEDPIQWGKGMHLLAWHMAVREIAAVDGEIHAKLDLFYKNWSEAMNEVITLTTWGAVRAAGRARFSARLALIQIAEVGRSTQHQLPGRIRWPGGGLSAESDHRAYFRRTIPRPKREEAARHE